MSRRVRGYIVNSHAVAMLCKKGEKHFSIIDGAPETAKFENAMFDYARNAFLVLMSDDSFDLVEEGCEAPVFFRKSVVEIKQSPDDSLRLAQAESIS